MLEATLSQQGTASTHQNLVSLMISMSGTKVHHEPGIISSLRINSKGEFMYFWNINELKQQLKNNSLPDMDSLKYLLLLSLIGMLPIPKPPYFTTGTFFYYIFGAIIFVIGTLYCFRRNGGPSGKDFLARYISLSWVLAIRFLPSLLLIGALMAFGFLSRFSFTEQKVIVMAVTYSLSVIYYWRIAHHITTIQPQTEQDI